MKRIIIIAIIVALVLIGVICIVQANRNQKNVTNEVKTTVTKEKEPTLVRVNEVTRSVFYSPQYVAIALGFFEENGIKVELTTGQGADKVMTAVLSGQSDIGFAGPEAAIYVYNEGKEDYPEVFAQLTKRDGSFLVSRESTDKFSWQDLKGKVVIPGRKGGVPYMTLEYVLKKNGLDPEKDLKLDDSISFDLMAGSFAGGNADYVTLFEPTASLTEEAGIGHIVASVGAEAGEIPYTAYFALKSYIKDNEKIIQNFTNAIYKGQKWVESHTAKEIAQKIVEFFPDTDVETLATSIQKYKDIDAWSKTPVLSKEAFEKLQDVIEEAGELEKRADYEKVVNNKYAKETIK